MTPLEEALAKQPQWVQRHVRQLQSQIDYARQQLAETAVESANVVVDPYADVPRGIGRDVSVRFLLPNELWIDVRHDSHVPLAVSVRASCGIIVAPVASNVVTVVGHRIW